MAWVILGVAGILEIAFAIRMKWSDGFTRLVPGVLTVATGLSSVILLSLSLRALPMGGLCMRSGPALVPPAPQSSASCYSTNPPHRRGCFVLRSFWQV